MVTYNAIFKKDSEVSPKILGKEQYDRLEISVRGMCQEDSWTKAGYSLFQQIPNNLKAHSGFLDFNLKLHNQLVVNPRTKSQDCGIFVQNPYLQDK